MYKCRGCEQNTLVIVGVGSLGDTIEVECENEECLTSYEVEPDGLGEGGEEFADALMIEQGRE